MVESDFCVLRWLVENIDILTSCDQSVIFAHNFGVAYSHHSVQKFVLQNLFISFYSFTGFS